MRIPDALASLFDYGILDEVVRPLMSGKEAQVYLVASRGELRVAKVYKEAQNRTFKHRATYTEGRKVRNSRDQRAMDKRSKHGRAQDEAAWRSTEVDMIHRLHAGGVRVPTPHHFIDGVLIMELIADADGNPAPRLGDLSFEPAEAQAIYDRLIREVMRMLCAGVVHGDLSDFNVLVGGDGPVLIDFPQAVDTAHNTNARALLLRDVENVHRFLKRFVPGARRLPYAEEMWSLYQQNALTPDSRLGGRFAARERPVDMSGVLDLIQDANRDERKRREALGLRGGPPQEPERAPRQGASPDRHDRPRPGNPPPREPERAPRQGASPDRHDRPRPGNPPPREPERAPRQGASPDRHGRPRAGTPPPRHEGPPQRRRPEHAPSPRAPITMAETPKPPPRAIAPQPAPGPALVMPPSGRRARARDEKATESPGVEVMFVRRPR